MKGSNIVRAALAGAVALASAPAANATELVSNGGFETGDFSGFVLADPDGQSFNGVDTTAPHSGSYGAYFGNVRTPATLSQEILTVANTSYVFSFYLLSESSGGFAPNNGFEARFNGATLLSLSNTDAFPYQKYTYAVMATSNLSTISFSAYNANSYLDLDDVSLDGQAVAAVPEPATWGMMLLGFSALGYAMRRRPGAVPRVRFA